MKIKFIQLFCFAFLATSAWAKSVPLEQEIGQMLMIGFNGTTIDQNSPITKDILQQKVGGVILFNYNLATGSYDKNIKDPAQLLTLTKNLQKYTEVAAQQHHNNLNPLLISIDYEGGKVNRLLPKNGFPATVSQQYLGAQNQATNDKYANQMADTLTHEGINLNFSPVLDVDINPTGPDIGALERSFSADPKEVSRHAAIFVSDYKKHHVLCSLKHFPGLGSADANSHFGFVDVSKTWQPSELAPYKELISEHGACDFVMTAHVVNKKLDPSGLPASLSRAITTDLLRQKLHFNGIVITDDLQMGAITTQYSFERTVALAVNSGADILLFANQLQYQPNIAAKTIGTIERLVKQGVIPRQRIDESYKRIVALKKQLATTNNQR